MTLKQIAARVARVRRHATEGDREVAHRTEDTLYVAVLRAIADGAPDAPALARAALEANTIDYDRYYS